MYLFEKAFRNLLKNKGRNIILMLIMFIVILSAAVSVTLLNTANQVESKTKNYYAGQVSLVQSGSSGGSQNQNQNGAGSPPAEADYLQFVQSAYLQGYTFYKLRTVTVSSLKPLDGDYVRPQDTGTIAWAGGNVSLYGALDINSTPEFADGDRAILSGGHFPGDGECMVSSDFAQLNGLKTGDAVPVTINGSNAQFTISAIYSDDTVARTSPTVFSPENNRRNDIIVDYAFFANQQANENAAIFQLKNASDITAFQNELYSEGLSSSYTVQYDTQQYNHQVQSVESVKQIVLVFAIIIFIVGCGIMVMMNMLALRERKYEIGVLRAIGMPKAKTAVLLLGELLILAIIAAAVALIAGAVIGQPIANYLIGLASAPTSPRGLVTGISQIQVTMSGISVLEVLGISIGLVLITGCSFISNILRFDPIQILSERN